MAGSAASVAVERGPAAAPAAGVERAARPPVTLDGRYEILPDRPIPSLDSPTALAFAARGRGDADAALFALVCAPEAMARTDIIEKLSLEADEGLLVPVCWEDADWPGEGERLVFLFEQPGGARLAPIGAATLPALEPQQLRTDIIAPLARALETIGAADITHRGVRPDNLFWRSGEDGGVVLGECVCAPPAWAQPAAYEPIDSAMAEPAGRGPGTPPDDFFSLGVTVLALLMGQAPDHGTDAEALLLARLEKGSYAALRGDFEPPDELVTLLRGLLEDDAEARWGYSQVMASLSGDRPPLARATAAVRSATPIDFGGTKYETCRGLAHAMAADAAAAASVIEGGSLERWLRSHVRDEARAEAVAAAHQLACPRAVPGKAARHQLVARVAIALDPAAPIRYKGRAVHLRGFGTALAETARAGAPAAALAEIVLGDLPIFWASVQSRDRPHHLSRAAALRELKQHLVDTRIGRGVERVLYEVAAALPCRSPIMAPRQVCSAPAVLERLEELAHRTDRPSRPIDRHLAAFLAARSNRLRPADLAALAAGDATAQALGLAHLFARLQHLEGGGKPLPGLASWTATLLAPVVEGFFQRRLREELAAALQQFARSGDIAALVSVIDNPALGERDAAGFAAARAEYTALDREIARLRGGTSVWPEEMRRFNGGISVALAALVAAGVVGAIAVSGGLF